MEEKNNNLDKFDRTRSFVEAQMERYTSYHQSKEAMAYAGITLFGGLAGAASVSSEWPPDWGEYSVLLAVSASVLLWGLFLIFLRFQLTRRRWAALRVAGCERLLAAWLQNPPTDEDLALAASGSRKAPDFWDNTVNFIWGSKKAVQAIDTSQSVYPRALVDKWLHQEQLGTDALKHERLILLSGWALFFILVGSTWLKNCNGVA